MKFYSSRLLVLILGATVFGGLAQSAYSDDAQPIRPKVALALGGGGTRGAAHVGVLRVLQKEGIPIDYIAGTSMGAVVGGLYAAGLNPDQIEDKFTKHQLLKAFTPVAIPIRIGVTPIFLTLHLMGWHPYDGFYYGKRFAKYLDHSVPENRRQIENLNIPFEAVTLNLLDGKPCIVKSGEFGSVLRASCAVPVIRRPVFIDNKLLVDGGVVANLPVMQAKDMGADIVIAVDVDERFEPMPDSNFRKIGSVGHRVMTLFLSEVDAPQRSAADILIHPKVNGIGLLSRNPKDAKKAIIAGEEAAQEALPIIRQRLNLRQAATSNGI